MKWINVCSLDDILPNTGVAALIDGHQVAIYRLSDDSVFALDNHCPASNANVLSRGLIGDLAGELVVASPIYKHHYRLKDGVCLEDKAFNVTAHPVQVVEGVVQMPSARVEEAVEQVNATGKKLKLVVVGNGMAGMRTVEELMKLSPELYDITVFGAEPHGNYNRILLSPVLAGEKTLDEIMIHSLEWYQDNGITLHIGDTVTKIDRKKRLVLSEQGKQVPYDRLLLATGSNPMMIPFPGIELDGVKTFRDIQDVNAMLAASQSYKKAVVIGGGLLGLEAANGLMKQGMDVTVVHLLDTLMERQLDKTAAEMLKESLEARGMKFIMPASTKEIRGKDRVTGLRFADGSEIDADLVVMAVGIKPNFALAASAGLHCDRGIVVDDTLQTYDPCIYAVGECVQHRAATYGLVAPLWDQAIVCANHLAHLGWGKYLGSTVSTKLKVTGIDLFSAGNFLGGEGCEEIVYRDPKKHIYKKLVVQDNCIIGAVLYGEVSDGAWYFELMQEARDVSEMRDVLIFGKAFAETAAA
jgi:nitrite reductase (NADH) large subunit